MNERTMVKTNGWIEVQSCVFDVNHLVKLCSQVLKSHSGTEHTTQPCCNGKESKMSVHHMPHTVAHAHVNYQIDLSVPLNDVHNTRQERPRRNMVWFSN